MICIPFDVTVEELEPFVEVNMPRAYHLIKERVEGKVEKMNVKGYAGYSENLDRYKYVKKTA